MGKDLSLYIIIIASIAMNYSVSNLADGLSMLVVSIISALGLMHGCTEFFK
jgi:hypothetical protein